ncbi:MAG TPA: DUF5916 domain-containing protein [Thermoanaerobaculia bacterium]|nr:DUF5916 domain-containing protein [Thermoanaerobaculia bacterium]
MFQHRGWSAGLAVLAVVYMDAPLAAKQGEGRAAGAIHPPYAVSRATSPIKVDGNLDDAAWQGAAVVELNYETRPAENTAPPVKTECLITYDDDRIYVAFRAHDPDPSQIRAHLSDRDRAFDDDFVGIVLDPFNDERRAFEFFVNPFGIQMDLFMDDVGGDESDTWDAIWASAGRVTETGFEVEIAIPFSSLRFPRTEGDQTWGFDALRFYPRSNRHRLASQPMDRNVSCYLCQISKMTGFAGVTPGLNMELTPTVTAGRTDARNLFSQGSLAEGDVESELGITGKWGMTPNLTLNAAINPDFSQVEADAAQLDINTTFALFFPEKRPFFLEGADFFRTPIEAVFTRNVADPEWGLKVTGKEGKNAVGVFVAQDDRTDFLIPGAQASTTASLDMESTDAVLRYRRDFGASSALGVLMTSREGDGYSNQLAGLDGLYRLGDSNSFRGQFLRSQTEYPAAIFGNTDLRQSSGDLEDDALYLSYNHSSRNWGAYAQYEDVGELFRADMGFLPQVDYSFMLAGGDRIWHGAQGDWWTRASVGGDWDERKDQNGNLLEREVEVRGNLNGPLQSYVELITGQRKRVFNGVSFDETFASSFGEFQPSGDLFLSLFVRLGDEIDFANTRPGEVLHLEPTIRYLVGRHLRFGLTHLFQQLDVEGGRLFEANLSQLTTIYQFNARTFVRLITQYTDIRRDQTLYTADVNGKTQQLFNQLLFSYKLNPQTVLFAGYSDNALGTERIDLARENRSFFVKLGYAWVP